MNQTEGTSIGEFRSLYNFGDKAQASTSGHQKEEGETSQSKAHMSKKTFQYEPVQLKVMHTESDQKDNQESRNRLQQLYLSSGVQSRATNSNAFSPGNRLNPNVNVMLQQIKYQSKPNTAAIKTRDMLEVHPNGVYDE